MKAQRLKAGIVLLLMLFAYMGAEAWRPTRRLADTRSLINLEAIFPKRFGTWMQDATMPVQLVSPDQQAVLNKIYNQTLSRVYVNAKGDRIMLSVAYGGDQSDATRAHRPEVCYPAQGFQILSSNESVLAIGSVQLRVRRLVSKLGGRIEPITYWITVGTKTTASGTEQKLAQLGYSVRGVIPDGMLVRVSSIDANERNAFGIHELFLRDMAEAINQELRPLVIGGV